MSDRYGSISINQEKPSREEEKLPFRQPAVPEKKQTGISWKILIAILALLLAVFYYFSALYLVPIAIHKYLPGYIQKVTGLSFSMGQVELNPFNFQLSFSDITADTPNSVSEKPLLQIPSLFVDMDLTSLLRNSFVCDEMTIKKMELDIIRFKDKRYNLPALSRFSKKQNPETIIDFTNLPFLFSFNNIDINNSRILLTDQVTNKTHTVEQLHLAIPTLSNFSFQSKDYILPHFSAIINNSQVELSGKTIDLEDGKNFQTRLSCSINDLDLIPYFLYLPDTFPLALSKGVVDLNLEIGFNPEKEQAERFLMDIKLAGSDILLNTKKGANKISLPTMQIDATLNPISRKLHFKTIVVKQPQLISNKGQLSRGLANFLAIKPKASKRFGLSIDLLLFDQGRLVLSDKENSIWNALQLTIKDFDVSRTRGSFYLNGEQAVGPGSFSWQGKLIGTDTVKGKLILNEFPASAIVEQLHTSPDSSVQGETEFTGNLTLSARDKSTTEYSLDTATLQFHNLKLTENKQEWLQADSVRLTRINRQKKHFNLGNIFLKNASLDLNTEKYPSLFSLLFITENSHQLQGIDFAGEVKLKQKENQERPLHFSDFRFQVNRLDKNAASENFAFTGKFNDQGVIRSRGKLSISPTALQATVTFSDVDSALFSPYLSRWPLLLHSATMLHGKGSFTYPDARFQGSLRFSDTSLQIKEGVSLLKWDYAELDKVKCQFSPFSLQAEHLEFQNPKLKYDIRTQSPFQRMETSLQHIFSSKPETEELFPFHIRKISFLGGSISLVDYRPTPAWKGEVSELKGYINNFNTEDQGRTAFSMDGTVEDAVFDLSGSIGLFQDKKNGRARLSLTNFPLSSFDEQLADSPVKPAKANISLQSKLTEKDSTFSNSTEMRITDLLPSSTNSDTALALAFLKDDSGNLPLTVHMDNTNRSLFQESMDLFRTTVIRASYAPLLLDQEFSDLQENDFILFQTGTNKISTAGKETLIRYSELLSEHPSLALAITGLANGKTDREELAKAIPPAAPRAIQDDELLELARERSLTVYDFFIHSLGIAPVRVSINDTPLILKNAPANGTRLGFRAMPAKDTLE